MAGWRHLLQLLREEINQRRAEGCVIPRELEERIRGVDESDAWNDDLLNPMYDELMSLDPDPDLAAREPDNLDEIRKLRPDGPRSLKWCPSDDELFDRLHGAWIGRCVGCALGKPVEGKSRKWIRRYLEVRDDWPLCDYISGNDIGDGETLGDHSIQSWRENIAFMEPDDDINYSLAGLGVLELFGRDFTWRNIAQYWLSHIPVRAFCTAEQQAVMNLLNTSQRGEGGPATPEFTRRYRNPCREWIGAQIRADPWGWACAGNPELAAGFAYRDACWTHERNGIYGEMMFAAIIAAAFAENDPFRLVQIGLSEIPEKCRLADAVRQCLAWINACSDFESCMDRLEREFADMSPVHTINNALICVLSLVYGEMNPERSAEVSVMCGFDTDCNAASVGSITGAASGANEFGGCLADRLNDTVRASIIGFQDIRITELAGRTLKVKRRIDS